MAILGAAWEVDSLTAAVGSGVSQDTTASNRDTTMNNIALRPLGSSSESYFDLNTNTTDFWFHLRLNLTSWNTSSTNAMFSFRNATTLGYRLSQQGTVAGTTFYFQKYNGTTWVTLLTLTLPIASVSGGVDYDFYLKIDATVGKAAFYSAGQLVTSFTGDTTSVIASVNRVHLDGVNTSTAIFMSELIVADIPTIGWRLQTLNPNAAGTYSEWTGAYTAVDESTLSDADFITTNVVNNRFLANVVDPSSTTLGSREVKSIVTASRIMRTTDATPNDCQHLIRTNSADYTSANMGLPADSAIYSMVKTWDTNPSTSAKWTLSEVQALQTGVKAV